MWIPLFYTLNALILLAGLLAFRQGSGERNFSLALVQTMLALPLLAGEYFFLANDWEHQAVQLVLFSELVFILIWFSLALRLGQVSHTSIDGFRFRLLLEALSGALLLAVALYFLEYHSVIGISEARLSFRMYSPFYFSTLIVLTAMLYAAWRLEQFWRSLSGARRWEYKFLVVGCYLVCGALAWSSSYRLTYLTIFPKHLQLLSALLLFGWAMMCYAVFHHRLLNRKIFVSRKVVYAFVVPSLLAAYLLGFGLTSLIMRALELEMSFVLKWLVLAMGLVAVGLFAFSGKIRRRVHFFISTHFYINKYEYRDEWLALSRQLQGALSVDRVVKALGGVLAESLYTSEIFIWVGGFDSSKDFKLIFSLKDPDSVSPTNSIAANDPLLRYLKVHPYFHREEQEPNRLWLEVLSQKEPFLASLHLMLVTPISIGNQLAGLIGLGSEFTGGKYSYDDFDLLAALGSQTASALQAVRMAEELAYTREQQAWHRLSAFVLHDVKNAATMLALLQANAPEHIHEPEFQQDMLELVNDALKRMARVEQRLGALKEEISPAWQHLDIVGFLEEWTRKIKKKLPGVEIVLQGIKTLEVKSDPELIGSVLENLLLNAYEAGGEGTVVQIRVDLDIAAREVVVKIIDNGPGITPELLPERLFQPFKTSKEGGSGIGLWQVKRVVTSLGWTIAAENSRGLGACFTLKLPLDECRKN